MLRRPSSGYHPEVAAADDPATHAMTDRLLTPSLLDNSGPRPGLYELRVLERRLRARIAVLDARVDDLLMVPGMPSLDRVVAVDVLCASIAEARELLDEVRREAAHELQTQHVRRARPRSWS